MVRESEIREGEQAVEMPGADDAGLKRDRSKCRQLGVDLHVFDHVRAAILRRSDRTPTLGARAALHLLGHCRHGPVLAGARGQRGFHGLPGRNLLRGGQELFLAYDAGCRVGADL